MSVDTVRFRPVILNGSGRRKGWAKHVDRVEHGCYDGYGVHGKWLTDGKEYDLPVGAVLLFVEPVGSAKNGYYRAKIVRLRIDSSLETLSEDYDWHADFLSVRDVLVTALEPEKPDLEQPTEDPLVLEFDSKRAKRLRYEYSVLVEVVGEARVGRIAPSWGELYNELGEIETEVKS